MTGDALWLLSWNLRNGLLPPDRSLWDTLRRRRGPAACTDKEHLITGMLPQEGGFAIMLQETGIATRAQEMHVAAALRDKGYTAFFSSRLAETGATSTSRGGGLLTAVSSKYVAEHEVLSFTDIVPGRAAALEIRTDGGGLTLINVHGPQAGCSPWAGRAAFWADIQMSATARSLGGRHPMVIAGDTNIYMDVPANPATEHFRAGWEACGFRRAAAGGEEDMTPGTGWTPSWSTSLSCRGPCGKASGLAAWHTPRWSARTTSRSAWPCRVSSAQRGARRCPSPTATQRATSSRTTPRPRPSNTACGRRSPPRRMNPPWRPGWVPQSSTTTGPCPGPRWTRCSNTSTRRMTPWRAWWDAGSRLRRERTRRRGTSRRAESSSRQRSSAMTPWQRARRQRTRRKRPGMASGSRRRSGSRRSYRVQGQLQEELERQAAALEEDIRQLRALLAADRKRAIKDFWRRHAPDIAQRWKAVRGAIEVEAPGPSGLWNVRVPNTQTLLTEAHDVMFAVRAFWRELYDKRPVDLPGFQAVLGRHVPRVPEGAWTQVQQYSMQDLKSALDKADGKAPGSNHVEARFIKALPAPVQWLLVHSYRAILRGAPPPMHWRDAHIWLSPKVPGSARLDDYRPITLGKLDMKLLTGPLTQRITEVLTRHGVVSDWQQGSLPGSNTGPPLFMAQRQLQRGRPNYVFSFDARKAFDTTPHGALHLILRHLSVPPDVIDLLLFLHTCARLRIVTAHGLTQPVYMLRGVRQGNPESPLLYALLLDPLLRAQGHRLRPPGGAEHSLIQAYIDDLLVVAHTLQHFVEGVGAVAAYLGMMGMGLNPRKCAMATTEGVPGLQLRL